MSVSGRSGLHCPGHCQIVIVDLPENALKAVFEHSEVALFVRVVVRGESIEGFHLLADRRLVPSRAVYYVVKGH